MNIVIEKFIYLKLKVLSIFVIGLFLLFGCAVPFQTAETLKRGKSEAIAGYSPITNLTIKNIWVITGYTDFGFGLDLVIPFFINSLGYVSGKQQLLSLGLPDDNSLNLLISGSAGMLLAEDECPNYYQINGMVGIKGNTTLLTIGGGILKDPRYSYDYMHNSFRDKVFKHILFGLRNGNSIVQAQIIYRGTYGNIVNIGIGIYK